MTTATEITPTETTRFVVYMDGRGSEPTQTETRPSHP